MANCFNLLSVSMIDGGGWSIKILLHLVASFSFLSFLFGLDFSRVLTFWWL